MHLWVVVVPVRMCVVHGSSLLFGYVHVFFFVLLKHVLMNDCDALPNKKMYHRWGESPRGAGHVFGKDVAESFAKFNNLQIIARVRVFWFFGFFSFHVYLVPLWLAVGVTSTCAFIYPACVVFPWKRDE